MRYQEWTADFLKRIHREVEASLLAVQVLLAQGAYAILVLGRKTAVSSPRQVLLEIRRQIQGRLSPRQQGRCQQRLAKMERELGACDAVQEMLTFLCGRETKTGFTPPGRRESGCA